MQPIRIASPIILNRFYSFILLHGYEMKIYLTYEFRIKNKTRSRVRQIDRDRTCIIKITILMLYHLTTMQPIRIARLIIFILP